MQYLCRTISEAIGVPTRFMSEPRPSYMHESTEATRTAIRKWKHTRSNANVAH